MPYRPLLGFLLCLAGLLHTAHGAERWFEDVKATATPAQLYRFLYALPKGGDLHNHLTGAVRSEWFWDAALAQEARGYVYYTRVRIGNCAPYGHDEFGAAKALLLFKNIQSVSFEKLDACGKAEFKRLQDLDPREKQAWLDSLRLDQPYEGRNEFFDAIWDRINDLLLNPYLIGDILLRNMQAFGQEGVVYLETQQGVEGAVKADGSPYSNDEVIAIYRQVLASPAAKATGVEVRFQNALLRFTPNAEQRLRELYAITDRYRDLYVGVNMVGREDNQKGYPLRFLPVLRELRHKYPDINLSIHAGESDEPDFHIRDTLLLGAQRIGHGVNLISDPDTLVKMRYGPYLVEINLISNLLLEYVGDYSQHPFPEYLRIGVPVALSTDDRGMWDSNMSDEFYVAVKEFNLSWEEIVKLGRNSLQYSFVDEPTKQKLLANYDKRIAAFAQSFQKKGWSALGVKPVSYGFLCRHYQLCLTP
ncbi:MAG: adenosine deaminase [Pseudomonadota bacterium]|nr:adenosine deaminase [Pseudomonadota bacterium]